MSDSALQTTLREMRAFFGRPRVFVIMAAVGLILGLSGPFQTFDYFLLVPRIVYWLAIAVTTFIAGSFFWHLGRACHRELARRELL